MLTIFLVIVLTFAAAGLHWVTKKKLLGRIKALERDLQSFSDVMSKMAEVQTKTYHKFSTSVEDLEERIMELSVPSPDSGLPLERRHRVLALARQGMALDDIVKRLKAPVGEAELILNLRKYMGGESSRAAKTDEQVSPYA